jgi:hypothetical protein
MFPTAEGQTRKNVEFTRGSNGGNQASQTGKAAQEAQEARSNQAVEKRWWWPNGWQVATEPNDLLTACLFLAAHVFV